MVKNLKLNVVNIPDNYQNELKEKVLYLATNYLKKRKRISGINKIIANSINITKSFLSKNKDKILLTKDKKR